MIKIRKNRMNTNMADDKDEWKKRTYCTDNWVIR